MKDSIKTYACSVIDSEKQPFYERRVVAQCLMQARYIYGAYLVVYGVLLLDSDTVTVKRLTLKALTELELAEPAGNDVI